MDQAGLQFRYKTLIRKLRIWIAIGCNKDNLERD